MYLMIGKHTVQSVSMGLPKGQKKTYNYNIRRAKDGDTKEIKIIEDPFWQKCFLVNGFPWKEIKKLSQNW